jgi:hypothetical protein
MNFFSGSIKTQGKCSTWDCFSNTIKRIEKSKEKKAILNTSRTRVVKVKALEVYVAADREVKKSTKNGYIEELALF